MSAIHPWYDEVLARVKDDPWHRECLAEVERLEPMFLQIRDSLSPSDQESLDSYIAACEQLRSNFIYPAYEVGRRHGIFSKFRE